MTAQRGARWIAQDKRQNAVRPPKSPIYSATAPLYEFAAAHDGMSPDAWLLHFMITFQLFLGEAA